MASVRIAHMSRDEAMKRTGTAGMGTGRERWHTCFSKKKSGFSETCETCGCCSVPVLGPGGVTSSIAVFLLENGANSPSTVQNLLSTFLFQGEVSSASHPDVSWVRHEHGRRRGVICSLLRILHKLEEKVNDNPNVCANLSQQSKTELRDVCKALSIPLSGHETEPQLARKIKEVQAEREPLRQGNPGLRTTPREDVRVGVCAHDKTVLRVGGADSRGGRSYSGRHS